MQISISDSLTIKEIQDKFSKKYPYLKIEFFSKSHRIHAGTRKEFMISPETSIMDCRSNHKIGSLDIYPNTTVAELEKQFQDIFGLYIQVFRKSGDVWIETTVTDDWTLEKQNTEAESFYNDTQTRNKTNRNHLLL
jgi:hypothetical protein